MRATALLAALLAVSHAALADEPKLAFDVAQLAVDGKVHSVDAVDLDGDGKLDLVAAVVKGEKREAQRSLAIFWNSNGSYAKGPDLVLPIGGDICAYDFAAIDDQPGLALLAVTPTGLSARRFEKRVPGPSRELIQQQTFCLGAPRSELRRFHAAQPLGAKGATGLLVPALTSISVYQRAGAQFSKRGELPIELDAEVETGGRGVGEAARESQGIHKLSVALEFPSVQVIDVNGDGRPDLVLRHEEHIRAFLQAADGSFASKPELEHTFRLTADTGDKSDDEKWQGAEVLLADVDGDGRVDAVISKTTSEGITSAQTHVYLFLGAADGFHDQPDQILASDGAGFSGIWLADFTGSGHPSLIVPSFKIGIVAIVRMLTSKTLKVNFQLFPFGSERKFATKPSAERTLKFHLDLDGKSDNQVLDPDGDYDGDHKRDLAFGTDENELSIFSNQKDALFTDDPVAKVDVRAYGQARAVDLDGAGRSDLVLWYPRSKGHESEIAVVHSRGVR